ncbi:UNKNOWN [Stylonychia lemnae]|uniref:EF-hand domain-containing protein n=1 Tax=Stylonychia lemnae TaxID=5949 RepID=A0A077ZSI4_STYLE|nr:UNKNOWN [Stylonychia lemnae]|eukprot:CDW71436.1 UNKNOWN [Stylonychia lemnae]
MFQRISSSFVNNSEQANKISTTQTDQGISSINLINTRNNPSNLQGQVRQKLQYEWKNLYRSLNGKDLNENGTVSKKQFEDALKTTGVFLTNEDMKYLSENFGDSNSIKYDQISQNLGLHQNSFNLMRETHSRINRIKTASNMSSSAARNHHNTSINIIP